MPPSPVIIAGAGPVGLCLALYLARTGVRYVDVGTSGGVWGLERGYCLMVGGERGAFELLEPALRTLDHAIAEQFVDASERARLLVADTLDELLATLETLLPREPDA